MSEIDALVGCRVQRIDGPRPEIFALTLHRSGLHGVLVLAVRQRGIDWGWVAERPRGDPASSFVQLLRKHVENARVVGASVHGGGPRLDMRRRDRHVRLLLTTGAETGESTPNLVLEVDGQVAGTLRPLRAHRVTKGPAEAAAEARPGHPAIPSTFEALTEHGPRLVQRALDAEVDAERRVLDRALRRRIAKLERRLKAIEGDLDRVDDIDDLRHRAGLLLSNLHEIAAGAEEAIVTDWRTDPPRPLSIPIDPRRTPREEADALFAKARRFERGGRIALERHEETAKERDALVALRERVNQASSEAMTELRAEALRLGVRPPQPRDAREQTAERLPFHRFLGTGGRPILVGRSARDNDTLTLSAKPWDHWLHARALTGSHVVVPLSKGETCPPELLVDGAHLAAHYSSARGEPVVEVQHCARRHLRKPRGAPKGAVVVTKERVIALRVEPERLARLLSSRV